jgi:hypothetical protein
MEIRRAMIPIPDLLYGSLAPFPWRHPASVL